jgi:hypothetical protein
VQITIPADDLVTNASENMAVLTSADGEGGGGAVRMNSVTRIVNRGSGSIDERSNSASTSNGDHTSNNAPSTPTLPQAYNVQVPAGVRPGSTFPVSLNGKFSSIIGFYQPDITDTDLPLKRPNHPSAMPNQC